MHKKMVLRLSLAFGLAAAAASLAGPVAAADNYPNKPIRLVVPFPAGGSTDALARLIGPRLAAALGQPVVVENRAGASATLGADTVARATADGYTLLIASAHHTIAHAVLPKVNYQIDGSFSPIGNIALVPNLVVVNGKVAADSVDALVAASKEKPDAFFYASAGSGSVHHLIGELFKLKTGAQLTHVPYSGSGPAVVGLLSDQVQVMFDTVPSALPHLRAGTTRALAATTSVRSSALPDVRTLQELGLADFNVGTWMGLLAPAGTPQAVVERLHQELVTLLDDEELQQQMRAQGMEVMPSTPMELGEHIRTEVQAFSALVKEANLQLE